MVGFGKLEFVVFEVGPFDCGAPYNQEARKIQCRLYLYPLTNQTEVYQVALVVVFILHLVILRSDTM